MTDWTWAYLGLAGLAGAFARALTSESPTWCRRSIMDTVMGGLASVVVYILLGILPWTATTMAKLDLWWEQVLTLGVLSYIASHVWTNRGAEWLTGLGNKLTGARTQEPPK